MKSWELYVAAYNWQVPPFFKFAAVVFVIYDST